MHVLTFNFSQTITATQLCEVDVNESGVLTVKVNGIEVHRIQAANSKYQIVLSGKGATPKMFTNVKFTSWGANAICTDIDTDKDGIFNRFDIDSDGDGCNDAVEAGAALKSVTIPFASAVGANGLADIVETVAESADVKYISNYTSYGLSYFDNACADTDGDGIGDILDIDKDNDGLADYIENNCTSPLFINRLSNATTKNISGVLLKDADSIAYNLVMSGPGTTYSATNYDGGSGLHFIVDDGGKFFINMNMKFSTYAGESNPTQTAPLIRSVDFGPNVSFNSPAKAAGATNSPQNIVLTWPGAFAIVSDLAG